MDLDRSIEFVKLLNAFRRVERVLRVPGLERHENDAEHSYDLAMLAWYMLETSDLGLDQTLVIKYALAHDLVEAYAGDTYIYAEDASIHASKHDREAAAAKRLREEFPDFEDLHALIEQYEKREDRESRFVYALDKIEPVLHIFEDKGRTWREKKVSIDMLIENKAAKVAEFPELVLFFNQLIDRLREQESELF